MIILFDTNAINQVDLRNPRTDIVRALRRSGQRVGVPGMVLEELVAHQAKQYMAQRVKTVSELNKLRRGMPWSPAVGLEEPELELEECQVYWREAYSELFEVVPTSGEAALKALAREALALPPAKRDAEPPEGGRDAAIWFTIIDYLQQNPGDDVYFVTANTKDFGDGVTLRYPMDQDIGENAGRLKRLKDFDAVVTAFTEPVDNGSAAAEVQRYLASEAVPPEIGKLALAHRAVLGFPGIDSAGGTLDWTGWIAPPSAALLNVEKAVGHRIGDQVWCTAEPTWLLNGLATTVGGRIKGVSCVWKIKLLFPVHGEAEEEEPTLLLASDPTAPDMRDKSTVEALAALRVKVLAEFAASQTARGGTALETSEAVDRLDVAASVRLGNALAGLKEVAEAQASLAAHMSPLREAMHANLLPDFSGVVEAMHAVLVPDVSGLIEGMNAPWRQLADHLRPRIDIASTLPTYTLATGFPALHGRTHDEDMDQVEDESDGIEASTDEVEAED
ncbi:PIN domain-containing protein [Kitasatospora sp. NPDC015120]|uniref:PIN domain-containing protein n=1 Tax=Kitasatospora sp. NPDC015120 TaxID=3364023 RepID=UPI0036F46ED4